MPASTTKLFTTGFARSVLGSDARRPTRVVGSGQVNTATGQWVGDWALELNGDVTLERGAGYGPSLYDLAAQMYAQGIRRLVALRGDRPSGAGRGVGVARERAGDEGAADTNAGAPR